MASVGFLAVGKREVGTSKRFLEGRMTDWDSEGKARVKCDSKLPPLATEEPRAIHWDRGHGERTIWGEKSLMYPWDLSKLRLSIEDLVI